MKICSSISFKTLSWLNDSVNMKRNKAVFIKEKDITNCHVFEFSAAMFMCT